MKSSIKLPSIKWILLSLCILFFSQCNKIDWVHFGDKGEAGHIKNAKDFSSDVPLAWMKLQLELTRTTTVPLLLHPFRHFAYCGIALYESVQPGMPGYKSLAGQITDLPEMPVTIHGQNYHWPTCANAALAAMNRDFLSTTSVNASHAIDSLENAFNALYAGQISDDEFKRSVEFGKAVAQIIFDWSKTDGSSTIIDPSYVPPVGPGLWVPTPPGFGVPVGPHWGNNRLLVHGSLDGSAPPPPPAYSEDPASPFFSMVKDVFDVSTTLTPDQIATALYYRENPGFGNAHSLSTTMQVLAQVNPKLDIAALVYAKVGITVLDASIGCWGVKYQYNLVRPITYIRSVMNQPTWNTQFPTPPHPEFSSGHSVVAAAVAKTLSGFFGENFRFTDHTYDYLGMAPRPFNSFDEMAQEIATARVYAGIHYRNSCQAGLIEGKKMAENISHKLNFRN